MMKFLSRFFTPTSMEEYIGDHPSRIISLLSFFMKESGYYHRFIRNNKNIDICFHMKIDICSRSFVVSIIFTTYDNDGSILRTWYEEILNMQVNNFYSIIKDSYQLRLKFLVNLTDILRRTQKRLGEVD
jgi:hypothetical protein